MAEALVRRLRDETLEDHRVLARQRGTSLEAELRDHVCSYPAPARREQCRVIAADAEFFGAMPRRGHEESGLLLER